MYINAQSVQNKINELREYIVEMNPDVICVTDRLWQRRGLYVLLSNNLKIMTEEELTLSLTFKI